MGHSADFGEVENSGAPTLTPSRHRSSFPENGRKKAQVPNPYHRRVGLQTVTTRLPYIYREDYSSMVIDEMMNEGGGGFWGSPSMRMMLDRQAETATSSSWWQRQGGGGGGKRDREDDDEDDGTASFTTASPPARKRRRCSPSSVVVVTPPQNFYGATSRREQNSSTSAWTTPRPHYNSFVGSSDSSMLPAAVLPENYDAPQEEEVEDTPRSGSSPLHSLLHAITGNAPEIEIDDDHACYPENEQEITYTSFPADVMDHLQQQQQNPPTYFPIHNKRLHRPLRWGRILLCIVGILFWNRLVGGGDAMSLGSHTAAVADHVVAHPGGTADVTLREFLTHPDGFSLGMAPAFFGFYGYFGTLAAWEETVAPDLLRPHTGRLRQVAGASAGAMAAILLAAGVSPLKAAEFCAAVSLPDFADPPGVLAVFRGDRFETIMEDYLEQESPCVSLLMEDALLPVAVSAFDLQTMAGQVLTRGSMARAARASATFPFLFQPVGWKDEQSQTDYTLIDGGVTDTAGVAGLKGRNPGRVVNLVVGSFWGKPPAPSDIPDSTAVLSVSLQNLPRPGPWAMELGPVAVEAASKAMKASLDLPLYKGNEDNHYELHIDASSFWN